MDPDTWRAVNDWGLQLLLLPDLARYCRLLLMEEDLQDEWEAVVMHPVSMLTFWLDNTTTRISGQRVTRRTTMTVVHGIGS